MSSPHIEVDLNKVRLNTQTIVQRLKARGVRVTGVTKAACGHPAIAKAMLDGGAVGLAEARISNVQRLRKAGITSPITLIRTPMLSQVDQVVQFCEASYNTEVAVIAALGAAAVRRNKIHGIILMVEMGDRREGILPDNLVSIAQFVMKTDGVALKGIGGNSSCLSGVAPHADQLVALSTLADDLDKVCAGVLQTVSGGNSASLHGALAEPTTGRINDLRLGEAILLGVDPVTGDQIGGLYKDAFTLIAEVIETDAKSATVPVARFDPTLPQIQIVSNRDIAARMILAIGQQDTDISGLSMPAGTRLIGATSDHLVIGTTCPTLRLGSKVRFQMNYKALMHAMAAPDIETRLLLDRPLERPRRIQTKTKYLTLV